MFTYLYCNEDLISFSLNEENVLCISHHSGRVCGGCEDGFSRVFDSDTVHVRNVIMLG